MDKRKVVIADDEMYIRHLVSRVLCSDYDVVEARNGEEAIDMVRTHQPDLILMNI